MNAETLGKQAKEAAQWVARLTNSQKNDGLAAMADALMENRHKILVANKEDMANGEKKGLSQALLDRLLMDEPRLIANANALHDIVKLADPVGRVMDQWQRPNGLNIEKISVPLGVLGVIYEARPGVTIDATGLALKSGNGIVLRSGQDSFLTATAIVDFLRQGLEKASIPVNMVQHTPTPDRTWVGKLLQLSDYIDVIIPRGGKGLIERVQQESKIPVFSHLDGICHLYLDEDCDFDMAADVIVNAKMRRTSICGAMETFLVHEKMVEKILPLLQTLLDKGCELRGDEAIQELDKRIKVAHSEDWQTEYLDAILSIKTVANVEEAITHINVHGSHHTDGILSRNEQAIETFTAHVDSAILMVNASTQFADGGEFGMGAEIGIATGRLHARGPVGVEQLTTYKYVVTGSGHTRP